MIQPTGRFITLGLLLFWTCLPVGAADQAVVNLQFAGRGGTPQGAADPEPLVYSGPGVLGSGNHWNTIVAGSYQPPFFIEPPSNFVADDGKTPVALELDYLGFAGADCFPPAQGGKVEQPLLNAYIVASGRPASLTLSRLVPGANYRVVLFGSNSRSGAGVLARSSGDQSARTTGTGNAPFPSKGEDYLEFTSAQADSSGRLVLEILPGSGPSVLNGLQIEGPFNVPAPAQAEGAMGRWAAATLPPPSSSTFSGELPIDFRYGEKSFRELAGSWNFTSEAVEGSPATTVSRWADPKTGLVVELRSRVFEDFPVAEWVATLTNTGKEKTPLISELSGFDGQILGVPRNGYLLHYQLGSRTQIDDFAPKTQPLEPDGTFALATSGGRAAMTHLPFFNVAWKTGGAIVAVGWPGQWETVFSRKESGSRLSIKAGQQSLSTVLEPDESIRTPRMVLLLYSGDWIDGQNLWRRWAIAHVIPRIDGKLPGPLLTPNTSHQTHEMEKATAQNQKDYIDGWLKEEIRPDFWWMDAGWYEGDGSWVQTGTWKVDKRRFPNGLVEISDHAKSKGVGTILWFEPERVSPGTELSRDHPEWLLAPVNLPPELSFQKDRDWRLLNLGIPEARKWITDRVSSLLTSEKIDIYRQDFNMDPLYYWQSVDKPGRTGLTENLHVQGYLKFWDDLKARHPGLIIDTCASGGRRNDLEAISRALPFLRSDYVFEPTGLQGQTYGLSFWYPYTGTGLADIVSLRGSAIFPNTPYLPPPGESDKIWTDYLFRSAMCSHFASGIDSMNSEVDFARLRVLFKQWRELAPNYYGDYYPLTPYTLENSDWMAWQFDRPELGKGMVQVFRRQDSPFVAAVFPLRGLDLAASYTIRNVDTEGSQTLSGAELLQNGLPVKIETKPGAVIYTYEKASE
jgi:alpha-galactosidase